MNSDTGAAFFFGFVVLGFTIGTAFEQWMGWATFGGGLVFMGILDYIAHLIRGE